MFQMVKFLSYIFVLQSIFSLRIENGKVKNCSLLALTNLIIPDVTYIGGFILSIIFEVYESISEISNYTEMSPFLNLAINVCFFSQPIIYGKRKLVASFVITCFKVSASSEIKFDETVKCCLKLFMILQLLTVTQLIVIYNTYYIPS